MLHCCLFTATLVPECRSSNSVIQKNCVFDFWLDFLCSFYLKDILLGFYIYFAWFWLHIELEYIREQLETQNHCILSPCFSEFSSSTNFLGPYVVITASYFAIYLTYFLTKCHSPHNPLWDHWRGWGYKFIESILELHSVKSFSQNIKLTLISFQFSLKVGKCSYAFESEIIVSILIKKKK